MDASESRAFLKGQMSFGPERMMRYIRSRARLSSQEDLEDILQTALILVTKHFDPKHPEAKLALYCLGACNKAIAQNLERYHKVSLKKRVKAELKPTAPTGEGETRFGGQSMKLSTYGTEAGFIEDEADNQQFKVTSLDSFFSEDGPCPEDIFGLEYGIFSDKSQEHDPEFKAMLQDLISQILKELPSDLHRACFVLKYVQGFKREDLIVCLKSDARSIDTIDKRITRVLSAFKSKLDAEEKGIKR
jgi:DNA-directed RNA polymerase specialized sigma24 family protein